MVEEVNWSDWSWAGLWRVKPAHAGLTRSTGAGRVERAVALLRAERDDDGGLARLRRWREADPVGDGWIRAVGAGSVAGAGRQQGAGDELHGSGDEGHCGGEERG